MALQLGIFQVACLEGFLRVCRGIYRVESQAVCLVECLVECLPVCLMTCPVECLVGCPVVCTAAWEEACLEDPVDPDPSNSHRAKVQGPVPCQGSLTNHILPIKAIPRSNPPDHKAYLRRWEWDIRGQRRHNLCWLSRTDRWKLSKGGTPKKGNREREVA